MEIKRLITNFVYRIEPKPEGGFIAYASDPAVAPLEAPTREELQNKIQANITAALAAQFPALQLPPNQQIKLNFHIESKPGGGFALHSGDPGAQPVEGTHDQIESRFAEKLISLAEKVSPELHAALAAQGASGDVKAFVNPVADIKITAGSRSLSCSLGKGVQPTADARALANSGAAIAPRSNHNGGSSTISDAPIVPERSGSAGVFFFLLGILVLGVLAYFALFRH
jgi:hypothetical protein